MYVTQQCSGRKKKKSKDSGFDLIQPVTAFELHACRLLIPAAPRLCPAGDGAPAGHGCSPKNRGTAWCSRESPVTYSVNVKLIHTWKGQFEPVKRLTLILQCTVAAICTYSLIPALGFGGIKHIAKEKKLIWKEEFSMSLSRASQARRTLEGSMRSESECQIKY